jgi:hypothetical protein
MIVRIPLIACALLLALLSLGSCAKMKHAGAAALAYDFARTGIVPGKHLACKTHVVEEQLFPGFGPDMGMTSNSGANLWVVMDKNKTVAFAAIRKPGGLGDPPGSIDTDFKTQDGRTVWGYNEKQITELYGKPSWTYIENANDPHVKNLVYDYRVNAKTVITVSFSFTMKGNVALPLDTVSAGITDMDEIKDTRDGAAVLYKWPWSLSFGVRQPAYPEDME